MNEKEELKQELDQELEWVKYRQKMLDIMEDKLLQMRELAEQAKQGNLTAEELESINTKINNLVSQVRALDSESRKTENEKVL
jgi:flagellin-like hook-associated protein FlgL